MANIQQVDGGWVIATTGGSVKLKDIGDGRVEVGDWECDGSNPHAALEIYIAFNRFVDDMNLAPVMSVDISDSRLLEFYNNTGWEATHLICVRQKDREFWKEWNNNE